LVEIEIKKKTDQSEDEVIEVWYAGTFIQTLSNWISVISIIVLSAYVIMDIKKGSILRKGN
jgi:phosphatidylglycerophosphatase A